jgi:hypothetical protein
MARSLLSSEMAESGPGSLHPAKQQKTINAAAVKPSRH